MTKPQLGGWLRLWITCCIIYGSVIAAVTWLDFPTRAPTVTREELTQALPKDLGKKTIGVALTVDELIDEQTLAARSGKTERAAMLAEEIRRLGGEARTAKPIFFVRGPDGGLYSINGPPGAKASEVYAEVWKSWREQLANKSTAPLWKSDPIILEMADGLEIATTADTTELELNEFRRSWKKLSDNKLSASRWLSIRNAFLLWLIPAGLLLSVGIAVGWIYRGFRRARGDPT